MCRFLQVEHSVAMQLCPHNAANWQSCPHLLSKTCKFSPTLTAKAYSDAGQATSALHAKVVHPLTVRSLGQTMSTHVVQDCHFWLTLADMRMPKKQVFSTPRSLIFLTCSLFGKAVENFTQQFLAVQRKTEVIKHILPWQPAFASIQPFVAVLPPARGQGHSPAAPTSALVQPKQHKSAPRVQREAGCMPFGVPKRGDLEMAEPALQETMSGLLLPWRRVL